MTQKISSFICDANSNYMSQQISQHRGQNKIIVGKRQIAKGKYRLS